jgi:hypothetical protein
VIESFRYDAQGWIVSSHSIGSVFVSISVWNYSLIDATGNWTKAVVRTSNVSTGQRIEDVIYYRVFK